METVDCPRCEGNGALPPEEFPRPVSPLGRAPRSCPLCRGKGGVTAEWLGRNTRHIRYVCCGCGRKYALAKITGVPYAEPGYCQCGASPLEQLPGFLDAGAANPLGPISQKTEGKTHYWE